ncbi:MAG: hypothetical protein ACOX6I_08765 [Syntrophomonadaceae bacterium]
MNRYKRWLVFTFIIMFLPLAGIGAFNFFIDPLWTFAHAHEYNDIQIPFDERQQKTNHLTFVPKHYDTLILGSSRTTYMKQTDLVGHKAYNYSVSGMLMEEYKGYAEYARQKNGRDFDYIVIGLDFFVTNKNLKLENEYHPPSFYINRANEFAYRYKLLLSLDVLDYSWKNFQASRADLPVTFDYNRSNIKTLNRVPAAYRDERIQGNIARYRADVYGDYEYREVKKILGELKQNHPHTQFIVFTTPVSRPMLTLLVEENLLPYYQRWLRDSVEVFGQVYNFMYPNSVTENLDNFFDGTHVYPEVETLIAHKIIGYEDGKTPADFGMLLTRDNVDQQLGYLESLMKQLR